MNLKELRQQSGKSREEVAQALNVTLNALSNYENGRRQINISQVLELSELYNESTEEIIKAQLNTLRRNDR